MPERITIADVAREAGVSQMTVSRVVNDKGDVSEATRQRVLAVIERLGYRPNSIARGLATKHTGTLGLVVPDVANSFFSDVARGAEQAAYAQGYNVFLCNTEEDPQRELAVIGSLEDKRVDGLVLCSSRLEEWELRQVVARHRVVVLVNRRLEGEQVRSVLMDDERGGRLATEHLLKSGHRAVGYLAGPAASHSGRERARGYFAAFRAAGLPHYVDWVQHCLPTVEGGLEAARALLTAHPDLTALFCYNDLAAVGALQAGEQLGRRVPDDLAVVGYDDIPLAALVTPPLTTCRVPRHELGVQAVRVVLGQGDDCSGERGEIMLRPELVVRASAPWRDEEERS